MEQGYIPPQAVQANAQQEAMRQRALQQPSSVAIGAPVANAIPTGAPPAPTLTSGANGSPSADAMSTLPNQMEGEGSKIVGALISRLKTLSPKPNQAPPM